MTVTNLRLILCPEYAIKIVQLIVYVDYKSRCEEYLSAYTHCQLLWISTTLDVRIIVAAAKELSAEDSLRVS
jgi:hypothetical protein